MNSFITHPHISDFEYNNDHKMFKVECPRCNIFSKAFLQNFACHIFRNPAASFGEVSKHVAALWDGMDADSKGAYKRRTEQAKKEYLRQLAAYRATLVSKGNPSMVDSPYNGKGLLGTVGPAHPDGPKPDDRPGYTLMGQR